MCFIISRVLGNICKLHIFFQIIIEIDNFKLDNFKQDTFEIPVAKENHLNVVKQRYNTFKPPTKVASTAVRSKAKILLLLLVHRLLLFPLFVGFVFWPFGLESSTLPLYFVTIYLKYMEPVIFRFS